VVSIQHDLPTDASLVTNPGALYAGRLPEYQRAEKTIFYAIGELRKIQPNADYNHLTMVGHSNGGDISMFFAQEHPDRVRMVVTLDNLRVPCLTSGTVKILSFRSKDWKPDRGVVPSKAQSIKSGIKII
jgi:pimeloyl-ACP methyl ester carboxylesterase